MPTAEFDIMDPLIAGFNLEALKRRYNRLQRQRSGRATKRFGRRLCDGNFSRFAPQFQKRGPETVKQLFMRPWKRITSSRCPRSRHSPNVARVLMS
mmetsp:Transcript_3315/g.9896  ORF Transcript_3315/g.9896 Transcript_3315/m.9896 type:complete len:96 (-) Transcript_3315:868-1155(-)